MWTGIGLQADRGRDQKLIRMEDELPKRVISQHEAIVAVSIDRRAPGSGPEAPDRLVHLP
jgi:ATP-dependent Clp protease ATP-binding subunit ClpA